MSIWHFNPLTSLKENTKCNSPVFTCQATLLKGRHLKYKNQAWKAEPLQSLCKTLPGKTDMQDLEAGKGKLTSLLLILCLHAVALLVCNASKNPPTAIQLQVIISALYCNNIFLAGHFSN